MFLLLFVIYFISYFSYRFYEKPIRYSAVSRQTVFFTFLLSTGLLFSFGYKGHKTDGFNSYFLKKYENTFVFDKQQVEKNKQKISQNTLNDIFKDNSLNVLIMGDSMAEDAFVSLQAYDSDESMNIKSISMDDICFEGLYKSLLTRSADVFICNNNSSYSIKDLEYDFINSDIIILTGFWNNKTVYSTTQISNYLQTKYEKDILLIGSAAFTSLNSIAIEMAKNKIPVNNINTYIYDNHINLISKNASKILFESISNKRVHYLDKFRFFCSENKCDLFYKNKDPKIWDNSHLTEYSLKDYGAYINNMLKKIITNSS